MRKAGLVCLGVLTSGLATGLWLNAHSLPVESTSHSSPVPVSVRKAVRRDVPVYLFGLGTVQAYNTVTARAQVDGQITEVLFKEGQEVKSGDVLVKIDPRSYQATLDQAVAKKAQDQAQLDNAHRDLQRYTMLLQKNSIASQKVDTAQALVAQLEAIVKGDEASIERANIDLGYTTIKSPLSGRTGMRLVDSGNIVHTNDATGLVTITQTRPIAILFTLPQDTLPKVVKAMGEGALPVVALSRDGQQQFDSGELTLIDNAIDQATGTIRLKATLPNSAESLWPGQFVTSRLHISTLRNVLTIVVEAVQNSPDGSYAYRTKSDGTIERCKLKLGLVTADTAVVEEGLEEDNIVVTSGYSRLLPGVKIEIASDVPETPLAASASD
ncbi:MAG TPA: efflux RND transporter periplasmic adaptor subunit [Methylocella sp.]|nr:efflux RND transporter periplasmic adaptor subunit [Methylocella sp.]